MTDIETHIERLLGTHSLVMEPAAANDLHWKFLASDPLAPSQFSELAGEATLSLNEHTVTLGGSISSEHDIGLHKKALLERFAPDGQPRLIRVLKEALDDSGVMNHGQIFHSTSNRCPSLLTTERTLCFHLGLFPDAFWAP